MAPTREIAVQGSRAMIDVSRPAMTELRVASFIGGISLAEDEAKLKSKRKCPHVAVGTPGRSAIVAARMLFVMRLELGLVLRQRDPPDEGGVCIPQFWSSWSASSIASPDIGW